MHRLIFVSLFFPSIILSQNISGKVYDAETNIKGAKINNKTKNIFTYTDETGNFNIPASINDSLVFTSLFHEEKTIEVSSKDFEITIVIELKKIINDLDEVLLTKTLENKEFSEEKYTQNLALQIQNDIKNRPYLYGATPNYGLDFVQIFSGIAKLFKKKKKKNIATKTITYKSLDSLFSKHKLFNKKLLVNDLEIPEINIPLFFEYCEVQNIDDKLLLDKNEFLLLDRVINYSKDFLVILNTYKKNNGNLLKD
ncbi:carboxypeptidase-like regulatory domain-containing protein [Algibacter aquimarinus]|uniref:CarboxypepD_reg-like domain-containing protein n=1 Tax=Algibacter aquimarinus TaxID=1136748 RepID=A0ABP9H2Z8_9FLAO